MSGEYLSKKIKEEANKGEYKTIRNAHTYLHPTTIQELTLGMNYRPEWPLDLTLMGYMTSVDLCAVSNCA